MREEKGLDPEKDRVGLTAGLESCQSVLPIGWLFSLASHQVEVEQLLLQVVKVSRALLSLIQS
jgi:hypothetical protein